MSAANQIKITDVYDNLYSLDSNHINRVYKYLYDEHKKLRMLKFPISDLNANCVTPLSTCILCGLIGFMIGGISGGSYVVGGISGSVTGVSSCTCVCYSVASCKTPYRPSEKPTNYRMTYETSDYFELATRIKNYHPSEVIKIKNEAILKNIIKIGLHFERDKKTVMNIFMCYKIPKEIQDIIRDYLTDNIKRNSIEYDKWYEEELHYYIESNKEYEFPKGRWPCC